MAVGYLAAFLGGVFALLSPCGALLLPGFFAYAFDSPARLVARTAVFYAGLAVTLVPLGMGAAEASRLVYGHQTVVATTAGVVLIGFGLLLLLGRGVRIGRFTVHTTTALSAAIFIALGTLFLANRGTGGLVALFTPASLSGVEERAQAWAGTVQAYVLDAVLLVLLAAVIITVTAWRLVRGRTPDTAEAPDTEEPAGRG